MPVLYDLMFEDIYSGGSIPRLSRQTQPEIFIRPVGASYDYPGKLSPNFFSLLAGESFGYPAHAGYQIFSKLFGGSLTAGSARWNSVMQSQ